MSGEKVQIGLLINNKSPLKNSEIESLLAEFAFSSNLSKQSILNEIAYASGFLNPQMAAQIQAGGSFIKGPQIQRVLKYLAALLPNTTSWFPSVDLTRVAASNFPEVPVKDVKDVTDYLENQILFRVAEPSVVEKSIQELVFLKVKGVQGRFAFLDADTAAARELALTNLQYPFVLTLNKGEAKKRGPKKKTEAAANSETVQIQFENEVSGIVDATSFREIFKEWLVDLNSHILSEAKEVGLKPLSLTQIANVHSIQKEAGPYGEMPTAKNGQFAVGKAFFAPASKEGDSGQVITQQGPMFIEDRGFQRDLSVKTE